MWHTLLYDDLSGVTVDWEHRVKYVAVIKLHKS